MRCTLALVVVLAAAGARGDIPKPDALAQPKPVDQVGLPKDLTRAVTPADNATTPDKVALGEKLFFDGRLSADGSVACATCHDPDKGFTDGRRTSIGIKQQKGHRNAPTVLNALYNDTQFWDGRAHHLEDQAKLPITNPIEMGQPNLDAAVANIANIPEYRDAFGKVFGRAPNGDDLARALAAYERTQVAFDSPFDRFLAGDEKALDASARRGWALFNGRGRCMSCHGISGFQPTFSDNKFHNIGVSAHAQNFVELARKGVAMVDSGNAKEVDRAALETDLSELGRFLVTKNVSDVGAFKTSTLRNVLITPPYFHDGSQDTLWDVIDHYNKGGVQNPYLDGGIVRLGLSESEIDDLVAFLASLTSDRFAALGKKELARQRALRGKRPQRDTAAALGRKAQGPGLVGPFGDAMPPQTLRDPSTIGGR
ncbi:MAG TPA: cytochrome c peroxidase [Polyangia bacterium]|nr:cytochrome c peroxidase [Polyangia bacterium]